MKICLCFSELKFENYKFQGRLIIVLLVLIFFPRGKHFTTDQTPTSSLPSASSSGRMLSFPEETVSFLQCSYSIWLPFISDGNKYQNKISLLLLEKLSNKILWICVCFCFFPNLHFETETISCFYMAFIFVIAGGSTVCRYTSFAIRWGTSDVHLWSDKSPHLILL